MVQNNQIDESLADAIGKLGGKLTKGAEKMAAKSAAKKAAKDTAKNTTKKTGRLSKYWTKYWKNLTGKSSKEAKAKFGDAHKAYQDAIAGVRKNADPNSVEVAHHASEVAHHARANADNALRKWSDANHAVRATRAHTAAAVGALGAGATGLAIHNHNKNKGEDETPTTGTTGNTTPDTGNTNPVVPPVTPVNPTPGPEPTPVNPEPTPEPEPEPTKPREPLASLKVDMPHSELEVPQGGLAPIKQPELAQATLKQSNQLDRQNNRFNRAEANGNIQRAGKLARKMANTAVGTNLQNQLGQRYQNGLSLQNSNLQESKEVKDALSLMERMNKIQKGEILRG